MKSTVRQIRLFETSGCHLCAEAYAILLPVIEMSPYCYELVRLDIADSDDLLDRYGIKIPVIKRLDTDAEIGWPFGESDLEFFLQ